MDIETLFNDFQELSNKKNSITRAMFNGDLNHAFDMFLKTPVAGEPGYEEQLVEISRYMTTLHNLFDEELERLSQIYVDKSAVGKAMGNR